MWNPDHPNIILSFTYRGMKVEIDQGDFEGQPIYAAWVSHAYGSAVAVPCVLNRTEAVRKAKRWVDRRLRSDSDR